MNKTTLLGAAVALVTTTLFVGNAAAVPFTGAADWTDIGQDDGAVAALTFADDAAVVTWGAGGERQSGYRYDPLEGDIPVDATLVPLGVFTHDNFAIALPSITGATLGLNVSFPTEGADVALALPFQHIETPNEVSPCAEGGVPLCPDVVVLPNASERVTFGDGTVYEFEVVGFSQDDGATITSRFLTSEEAINEATLFGRLVRVSEPPAPTPVSGAVNTLPVTALFATALLVAGRRRL